VTLTAFLVTIQRGAQQVGLSGRSSLVVSDALLSPAAQPVSSTGQSSESVGTTKQLGPEPDPYSTAGRAQHARYHRAHHLHDRRAWSVLGSGDHFATVASKTR
jgi:hypothetical protein